MLGCYVPPTELAMPVPQSPRAPTEIEVVSTDPGERAWRWSLSALGIAVPIAYVAVQLWLLPSRLGLPLDDSWIHLVFARNLARGAGLAINPGELVAGSTAPLWTALEAILFLLPGSPIIWIKLLGTALFVAVGRLTFRLARELDLSPNRAGLAGLLVVSSSLLAWSAVSGMEVLLFAALTLAGVVLHVRERRDPTRPPLSLGVLGVAVLARPEGVVLLACALLDRLLVPRRTTDGLEAARPDLRRLALGFVAAVLAVAPILVFYRVVGGSFLPTTFAAKTPGPSHWLPDLERLAVVFGLFLRSQPWLPVLAPAGLLVLISRLGERRDAGLALGLWPFALPLAYSTFGGSDRGMIGNFGRYYFPLVPFFALLAVLAIDRFVPVRAPRLRLGHFSVPWRSLGVLALLAPGVSDCVHFSIFHAQNVINVEDSDVRLAAWLAPRLDPRAELAVNDIGVLKYALPNHVLDLAGIATPEVVPFLLKEMPAHHWTRDQAALAYLEQRQPDYVAVFSQWFPILDRLPERFPPLHRIRIAANITMGGDELVVYGTPWTRYPLRDVPVADGPSR